MDENILNVLMHKVDAGFSGCNYAGLIQHLTLDDCNQLGTVSAGSGSLSLVNSLLANLDSFGNTGCTLSYCQYPPSSVFVKVLAGNHYLIDSTYRNASTTAIDSTLAGDLKKRTTYALHIWTTAITSDTTLRPRALRDGVAVGIYGTPGINLLAGAKTAAGSRR